jgi:hypothetical protein
LVACANSSRHLPIGLGVQRTTEDGAAPSQSACEFRLSEPKVKQGLRWRVGRALRYVKQKMSCIDEMKKQFASLTQRLESMASYIDAAGPELRAELESALAAFTKELQAAHPKRATT